MSVDVLNVVGETVDPDEAILVALGYAFANRPFVWRKQRGAVGEPPHATQVGRWAYRTYDCVKAHESPELSAVDLLIAAGLNGPCRRSTVVGASGIWSETKSCVRSLPL